MITQQIKCYKMEQNVIRTRTKTKSFQTLSILERRKTPMFFSNKLKKTFYLPNAPTFRTNNTPKDRQRVESEKTPNGLKNYKYNWFVLTNTC